MWDELVRVRGLGVVAKTSFRNEHEREGERGQNHASKESPLPHHVYAYIPFLFVPFFVHSPSSVTTGSYGNL